MSWIREPLLHFAVLGVLLFGLSAWLGGADQRESRRIVVTPQRVQQLVALWQRTWQRAPSEAEIAGIIEEHVEEEILYREALALGLDRDDTIVRRRLRQKMDFLADDLFEEAVPQDAELDGYLKAHAERFRDEPRLSFRHEYIDPGRWREAAGSRAQELLLSLSRGEGDAPSAPRGDPLLLPSTLRDAPRGEVARLFGEDFADALLELAPGRWHGPLPSAYGLHVVRIDAKAPARLPELAEVRTEVEREWRAERREEARRRFYARLREQYDVRVELPESVE